MEKAQLSNRRYVYNSVPLRINEFSSNFFLFRRKKCVGIFNGRIIVSPLSMGVNLRAGRIGWRKSHFRSITKDLSQNQRSLLRITQKIIFLLLYILTLSS